MPNWCEQDLSVSGPKEDVDNFYIFASSQDKILDEKNFLPMPQELREVSSGSDEMYFDAWYGDPSEILNYPWAKEKGIKTREVLQEFFINKDANAKIIADKYLRNYKKYGFKTWYDWAIETWGSKWGICNPTLVTRISIGCRGEIDYCFESAWSPVDEVIIAMSRQFPSLLFVLQFFECGMGFQGRMKMRAGEVVEEDITDYDGPRGG